jgi:AraC-like DNA-binding protein
MQGFAQVTIIIDKLPEHTPPTDTLYLAGTLNDWSPGKTVFGFSKQADGTYSITLKASPKKFDYKITRGSWPTVEGDINGKKTGDRRYSFADNPGDTVNIQILSWEDQALIYHWNIIVKEIPSNTPFDASIFISGNFNNWKENDENFKLTKLENGIYAINIPKTTDTLWYKFNRGSWSSVEARYNGRTLYNRNVAWNKGATVKSITCTIEGWEDLTNGTNLLYSFILLASAFQAIILILAVAGIKDRSRDISLLVMGLLALTCIVLFARTATYNRTLFNWAPKVLLLSDMVYFLYAPLFFAVIRKLSGLSIRPTYWKWLFVIPAVIQLALYFPLLIQQRDLFINTIIDQKFSWLFNGVELFAIVYNVTAWISCARLLNKAYYKPGKLYGWQNSLVYVSSLLIHSGICLLLWLAAHAIYASGKLFDFDARIFHEISIDVLWVAFALSTSMHAVLLMRYPNLFRAAKEDPEKQKVPASVKENIDVLKNTLTQMMKKEKPFLNSKLTLQDLADRMHTNIHTLSRIINEGYQKNFFDFINEYRIEEFKKLVSADQYKNYTFLAVAMEVGFSSKTTFNRSFKKSTGKTPREFFHIAQESQLESLTE